MGSDKKVSKGTIKKHRQKKKVSPFQAIYDAQLKNPYDFLGWQQRDDGSWVVRVYLPDAIRVELLDLAEGSLGVMAMIEKQGLFEKVPHQLTPNTPYIVKVYYPNGDQDQFIDPYAIPALPPIDWEHIDQYRLQQYLGSHLHALPLADGSILNGVRFSVYAPHATHVALVGDFNCWDGRRLPMQHYANGIWQIFVPKISVGAIYKYEIKNYDGSVLPLKADPYAYWAEQAPGNASIVFNQGNYQWSDGEWQHRRSIRGRNEPLSIYEVHLGSWQRKQSKQLTYRELADSLVPYVKRLGFTHIEMLPVTEHPFEGSWGYQTTGMFAPTSRLGTPEDFKHFVDTCHKHGIGVILDWVPAHFPKDGHGLAYFDGTALYHDADPRKGEHPDWGTLIYNYADPYVSNFLISSALYWLEHFHIDGLRVDAVASMLYLDYSRAPGQWVANKFGGHENLEAIAFLRQLNRVVQNNVPGALMVAEESTAWPKVSKPESDGGLGFTHKWNMGWMHDTLVYMRKDPVHRKYHHDQFTFPLIYAFNENFVLPLSHDEVVHCKGSLVNQMPGSAWHKLANLRAYFAFMFAHPGKKLLFMGSEIAQQLEWNHDTQLQWGLTERLHHKGVQRLISDCNRVYRNEASLYQQDFNPKGFEWIEKDDSNNSVISFIRYAECREDFMVIVCNMTPVKRNNFRIGVPQSRGYRELLNTDAAYYGGSNAGNYGYIPVDYVPWHGFQSSIRVTLPPLSTLVLKPWNDPNTYPEYMSKKDF